MSRRALNHGDVCSSFPKRGTNIVGGIVRTDHNGFPSRCGGGGAVFSIIVDETARPSTALLISFGWAAGATMQIAAGIIARMRPDETANA